MPAQNQTEVEQLKKQLQEMKESFERVQREQRQQIDTLTRKVDQLTKSPAPTDSSTASTAAKEKTAEEKKLEEQLAAELTGPSATNAVAESKPGFDLAKPMTVMRAGSAYMNISFDALMDAGWSTMSDPSAQLQLGDHDPLKRGFSLRNAEIAIDGAIDPYFKGFANIVLKLDKDNGTEIELEEAYLQSTSLPYNLQLKAGQFFSPFGRNNPQHPHQWAFVDAPIISTRAFGPDGLRSISGQLSWLTPLPFYTEVFLDVLDGQGGTAFSFRNAGDPDALGVNRFAGRATSGRNLRGFQDLVYVPHIASSFELTDTQTLLAGVSGAFGPNETGPHNRTEVYGADLYWKWKPANAHEGFPFVSWQTEGIYRRFGAGADPSAIPVLSAENLRDYGFYSQVLYGFKPHWVGGLRGDFAAGNAGLFDSNDPFRGDRFRVSPVLTWYPSEFSKIRLQYNYDHGEAFGTAHSVWMQVEFLLGAHGAHKF
ncbi:MAG: hypothetical protein JWM68_3893 [Verrucomicrobiales bacterium]|nr:hypothetical protein [Verrucomicrobiales bacterium]